MVHIAEKKSEVDSWPDTPAKVPLFRFPAADTHSGFEAWRVVLSALFDCSPRRSGRSVFDAQLTVRHFGTFLLCRSFSVGGRYSRSAARLRWDDLDHIVVSCLISGRIALPGKPCVRLRPGDVTLLDLSSPAFFSMAATEALHLIMPRISLPVAVASVAPAPLRLFSVDSAMGIFTRGILESLSAAAPCVNGTEGNALGAAIPDLLGWCLGTAPVSPATDGRSDLLRRLRRHIEQNLDRTDLTSSRLSREVGVSRSQLYRQFEKSGGVDTYIRQRRLRRSLIALSDPRQADRRIGDIAYDVGFKDEAHFSRLFRHAFGRSPRESRNAIRQGEAHLPGVAGNSFADWLATLGAG